jgi:hypothetical protein
MLEVMSAFWGEDEEIEMARRAMLSERDRGVMKTSLSWNLERS